MSCIQSSKAVGSGTKLKSTTVTNAILVHYKTIQREEIQIKTFRKNSKISLKMTMIHRSSILYQEFFFMKEKWWFISIFLFQHFKIIAQR